MLKKFHFSLIRPEYFFLHMCSDTTWQVTNYEWDFLWLSPLNLSISHILECTTNSLIRAVVLQLLWRYRLLAVSLLNAPLFLGVSLGCWLCSMVLIIQLFCLLKEQLYFVQIALFTDGVLIIGA